MPVGKTLNYVNEPELFEHTSNYLDNNEKYI